MFADNSKPLGMSMSFDRGVTHPLVAVRGFIR
jgi:hypothetical protein